MTVSSLRRSYTPEHDMFREAFRQFVAREVTPHFAEWETAGIVPRELFAQAGRLGYLGFQAPTAYGGGGVDDFLFNAIISEELMYAGHAGVVLCFSTHNDVCLPYLLELTTEEQRARWLPPVCSGEAILAIAMTEPHSGSDLAAIRTSARRDGDHYVLNGAKTFITNGVNADLVIVAAKTDDSVERGGLSLLVVERGMPGFERSGEMRKLGLHCQDTAELFFDEVRVPVENLIGIEGDGLRHLAHNLAQERLGIAIAGVAAARAALERAVDYTKDRHAFGQPISKFQNTKFRLAEMATEVELGETFVDACIRDLNDRRLAPEVAAMAKWWCTELQKRTVDAAVQLHGGYGYLLEYPIARAYADARITTIYGGTTEIMKEIIGRKVIE